MRELREILGLKKNEYREFFNFKVRVLESARLELLEKTGKSFTWESVRQGRGGKVTGIRFVFDGENGPSQKEATVPALEIKTEHSESDAANHDPSVTMLRTTIRPLPVF